MGQVSGMICARPQGILTSTDVRADCADCGPRHPGNILDLARLFFQNAMDSCQTLPPYLLQAALRDALTWDAYLRAYGSNGSLRNAHERQGADTGFLEGTVALVGALKAQLDASDQVTGRGTLSFADLFALGGAEALARSGGPVIPLAVGRRDSIAPDSKRQAPLLSRDSWASYRARLGRNGLSVRDSVLVLALDVLSSVQHSWMGPQGRGETFARGLLSAIAVNDSGSPAAWAGIRQQLWQDQEALAAVQQLAGAPRADLEAAVSSCYTRLTLQGARLHHKSILVGDG